MASSHVVASHITKLLSSCRQILQFRFRENRQGRIPPWKVTKTRPFLFSCYGYPSTTEVPPCCQAATKKLTFSTTSVLLLLNIPLSLSRGTVFRRQKNPRRGYRPKIAGILFVCNEPEGKYYTVPDWARVEHLTVTGEVYSTRQIMLMVSPPCGSQRTINSFTHQVTDWTIIIVRDQVKC